MRANDLRDLLLSIVKGERAGVSQRETNLAISAIREMLSSSADLTDAFFDNTDIYVAVKEVDGEVHVLTNNAGSFVSFDAVEGEPKIESDRHVLEEELARSGHEDALIMKAAEALEYEPQVTLKP